jgi:hypothetical protein
MWALYRQSGSDPALKKSQLTCGDIAIMFETMHRTA